jgi:hypothetical protein
VKTWCVLLIDIKMTSYYLSKTHYVFSHQGSSVTVQNSVIDLRRYFPCNKFKMGRVSNKRWSADHGLLATDTFASLVDTLALITRHISFLKGGHAAVTMNVSEFRRDFLFFLFEIPIYLQSVEVH